MKNELTLAMLGRGDLRVEMDPRAVPNMHDIQVHFLMHVENMESNPSVRQVFSRVCSPPKAESLQKKYTTWKHP